MDIQLVVFDMAGTTVQDFDNVHEALQEALSNHDVFVTRDDVNEVMGLPKPIAIEALLKKEMQQENVSDAFVDMIYEDFVGLMIEFYENDPIVREKEGASELFRILKSNGIKIVLDTGFSRRIADTIINRLGWQENDMLDFSVTSDEVERGRPFPDMIFAAMKELQIPAASQVAKVGDTSSDMEEGTSAGCAYVVGITSGAYTREQLETTSHTHLIDKLLDLPAILGLEKVETH